MSVFTQHNGDVMKRRVELWSIHTHGRLGEARRKPLADNKQYLPFPLTTLERNLWCVHAYDYDEGRKVGNGVINYRGSDERGSG